MNANYQELLVDIQKCYLWKTVLAPVALVLPLKIITNLMAPKSNNWFPTIWRTEVWKQGVSRNILLLNGLGENPSLPLLASVAPGPPLLVTVYLQPPPPSRRPHKDFLVRKDTLLTCVSLKRTLVTGLKPHQDNPVWLDVDTLCLITFERFFVKFKFTFTVSVG